MKYALHAGKEFPLLNGLIATGVMSACFATAGHKLNMKEKFEVTRTIQYENSFGRVGEPHENVKFNVIVSVNDETEKGWWEISGGEHYASGELLFEGKRLYDYDGIYSLPDYIADKLEEHGYDVSYLKD